MRQGNRGITLISFIFFAVALCALGVLAMRITPVYIKHYEVLHAAKALRALPADDLKGPPGQVKYMLRSKLMNQLYVNMIHEVKAKDIKVIYKRKKYLIKIKYQTERPLIYNMRLLFDFDSEIEVPISGS